MAEYDGANTLPATYIHGPGIDEPLEMKRGGVTYFYQRDGLDSIVGLANSAGTVVRSYRYDSFGRIINETGSVENPYIYTGRERDAETGMYYYRARYYDPQLGRFISEDPIGFKGGNVNMYVYVRNEPISWVDPWGLKPGDRFKTTEEAAVDAIRYINPTSVREGREYGGWIHIKRDGSYSYKKPAKGAKASVELPIKKSPDVEWYHAHGASDPGYDNENFSPADKDVSYFYNARGYLGTPGGLIKVFDVYNGKINTIGTCPVE